MANIVETTTFAHALSSDKATLSGGDWQMAIANIQSRETSYVARSTDDTVASTQWILDFPTTTSHRVTGLVLAGVNFTGDALIKMTAAASVAGLGSPSYTLDWRSVWPSTGKPDEEDWEQFHIFIPVPLQNYKSWKIEIDDDPNPAGYVEIARQYFCELFVPTYNVFWSLDMKIESYDLSVMTPYGGNLSDERDQVRMWTMPFDFMTKADRDTLDNLSQRLGTAKDFFTILGPTLEADAHRYMMPCKFVQKPGIQPVNRVSALFKTRLDVTEIVQ